MVYLKLSEIHFDVCGCLVLIIVLCTTYMAQYVIKLKVKGYFGHLLGKRMEVIIRYKIFD